MSLENVVVFAPIVIWLAAVFWGLRETWRVWQPARLLLLGRWDEAHAAAERLERSWLRVFMSVRRSARYAIASAQHLRGDLEAALATLATLHDERIRGNLRYAVDSIEAATLVLLDRDYARAGVLLAEAGRIHQLPEDLLLLAIVKHALGEHDAAERLFASAGRARGGGGMRLGAILLVENRRQQEAIFHMLRGLYLLKTGLSAEAQHDLELAARAPITNTYVERARALLQRRETEPEGPSSLAPQVVATDVHDPE